LSASRRRKAACLPSRACRTLPVWAARAARPLRRRRSTRWRSGIAEAEPMRRPPHKIVRGHTVPPRDTRGRREGFTTGTAAAAAAKAACLVLLDRGWPETVSVQLPIPRVLEIPVNTLEWTGEELARRTFNARI